MASLIVLSISAYLLYRTIGWCVCLHVYICSYRSWCRHSRLKRLAARPTSSNIQLPSENVLPPIARLTSLNMIICRRDIRSPVYPRCSTTSGHWYDWHWPIWPSSGHRRQRCRHADSTALALSHTVSYRASRPHKREDPGNRSNPKPPGTAASRRHCYISGAVESTRRLVECDTIAAAHCWAQSNL